MKITFKTANDLEKALRDVIRIVPASTTRQVLKYVFIHARMEDDRVDICTSSEDTSLRRSLFQMAANSPVTIEKSGSCLLPAKELYEIVRKADGFITLENHGSKTLVSFGQTKYELAGLEPDMFTPYEPKGQDVTSAVITAPELHRLLRRTTYAAFKGEARPTLTGVHLTLQDGSLHAVATDGLRLAQSKETCQSILGNPTSLTVSATSLDKLAASLPAHDEDEEVTLAVGSASISVSWDDDGYRMIMRGLDGNYPDVSRVIPQNVSHKIFLDRSALLEACERVAIVADAAGQKLEMNFEPGRVVLSATCAQYTAQDVVESKSSTLTEPMLLWVNVNYCISMLRSLDGVNEIEVGLVGINQPFTVRPVSGETLCLIAPMLRANNEPVEPANHSETSSDASVA